MNATFTEKGTSYFVYMFNQSEKEPVQGQCQIHNKEAPIQLAYYLSKQTSTKVANDLNIELNKSN